MRRPPTPTLKRGRQTKALADLGVSELIEIVPKPEGAKGLRFCHVVGCGTELGEFFAWVKLPDVGSCCEGSLGVRDCVILLRPPPDDLWNRLRVFVMQMLPTILPP